MLTGLTRLPVIPTQFHSDHTNGLRHFERIALVDLPETRALVRDGKVHLRRRLSMISSARAMRIS